MNAELAAGYCGENTAEAFLRRVGSEYPEPVIDQRQRKLWLKDDLDRAIAPQEILDEVEDAADVL